MLDQRASLPAVEIEVRPNVKSTMFMFGGIAGGFDIPPFEFRSITASLNVNRVFFRDLGQCWYQDRVRDGLFSGLPIDQKDLLQHLLRHTHSVFLGNSMGAYAAIYFGSGLGADRTIAFAPQTFIGPLQRLRKRDYRWQRELLRMYLKFGLWNSSYDLRQHLKSMSYSSPIDMYVGELDGLDLEHAKRLSSFAHVRVNQVAGAKHGAVRALRDAGKLRLLLEKGLMPRVSPASKRRGGGC